MGFVNYSEAIAGEIDPGRTMKSQPTVIMETGQDYQALIFHPHLMQSKITMQKLNKYQNSVKTMLRRHKKGTLPSNNLDDSISKKLEPFVSVDLRALLLKFWHERHHLNHLGEALFPPLFVELQFVPVLDVPRTTVRLGVLKVIHVGAEVSSSVGGVRESLLKRHNNKVTWLLCRHSCASVMDCHPG